MKLFFVALPIAFLFSCQSNPHSDDKGKSDYSNPIKSEYSLNGEFSDYQFFKNSLPQFSERCFERAKRWALLKEGPDVLSALNSDVIEGTWRADGGPDPTLLDWMPWWMDVLKIDVSALIITKSASLTELGEKSCVQIYLDRLEQRVASGTRTAPAVDHPLPPRSADEKKFSLPELWRSSAPTGTKEKQLTSWMAQVQLPPLPMSSIRELYFTRSGIKRRLLMLRNGNARPYLALEIPLDPYRSKATFPKGGEANACQRLNLGISFAKKGEAPPTCSDLEGPSYAVIPESFLESVFRQIEQPHDADARAWYVSRCQQLADVHASQWLDQDVKYLLRRLKTYPQIKKRLAYFATMESQEVLARAAKNRSP